MNSTDQMLSLQKKIATISIVFEKGKPDRKAGTQSYRSTGQCPKTAGLPLIIAIDVVFWRSLLFVFPCH
jgi:hypothetical protein